MTLPAGFIPSRYVGELEVITVRTKPLHNKRQMRKRSYLINREVRVFQGRLKGRPKYIHSSPITRIEACPTNNGQKLVLVENGKWYRVDLVLYEGEGLRVMHGKDGVTISEVGDDR